MSTRSFRQTEPSPEASPSEDKPGLSNVATDQASATDADDTRDPLDHDGDGHKGGVAPAPEVTHLVVLQDDVKRGLTRGEVIGVADAEVKALLADDVARSATETEVELAQPRVRVWSSPAA